ncbi:Pr5-like receptor kinase [Thalictrum thalictroides]|uniref:non-specific serine/threonine protein kinase n=1 Tax=Thalictrum thalictroides TaxID=46969 RepID=A0A7J6VUW0_THATH|nr:Pr5-like receptor kinase [Thalictrum thalictroides]
MSMEIVSGEGEEVSKAMDLFGHVKRGDLEYIKTAEPDVLLKARDKDGMSVLSIAAINDQLDCCKEILNKCPSLLYHQNNFNNTVLHHATYYANGIFRLIDFFVSAALNAAKDEGAIQNGMTHFKRWIKVQNSNGDTALTQAAYYRNLDIVKRFVEVDRQYKLGLSKMAGYNRKTALELALEYQDNEMIELLIDSGHSDVDYSANIDGTNSLSPVTRQAQGTQQTGNSTDMNSVQSNTIMGSKNMFTLAEVSKHNNSEDCWLVINDKVYDVTKLLGNHPGEDEVLLAAAGKDVTDDFEKVGHSIIAREWMADFYVGEFESNASLDSITRLLFEVANEKPQPYSHAQLISFTKEFSVPLGSGGFGDVYKGQFPDGVPIAVKVLKNSRADVMKKQFMAEVSTMGRTYHRNLIKLYGYCNEANTKALIYEYMEKGALDVILKKNNLDMVKLYTIAIEIARGISYLHESCYPQIIHHDLKPANVLLDSKLSPRIIDFGLAKLNMEKSQFTQTGLRGTRGYVAPEMTQLELGKISYKCDVFSFGMILFDILKSKINCAGQVWLPGKVWKKFKENQLDSFLKDCGIKEEDKENAMTISKVALLCAEHNPQDRPSMSTVVKMLEREMTPRKPVNPFPLYDSSSDNSTMEDSRY